ncbi:MAG: glycosyltransferase [Chitinophagaceae bacterium]|nr:glycosyltransferase [Chitinophagaceae bacterium]
MRRLKILQCLVFYLPNRIGGIEVYVHSLNLSLLKKGHDVKVVVPNYPGEKPYAKDHEGVPVVSYTEFQNETKAGFEGDVAGKSLPGFIDILKQEKPDVVHFHQLTNSNGISIFHMQAARELGIKVFYTNHLAGLTCTTGKMVYREKQVCDGIMREVKCAVCDLKKYEIKEAVAWGMVQFGAGISSFLPDYTDSKLMQLLTYSKRIARKKKRVKALFELVDRFIVITDWYHRVLQLNGIKTDKIRVIKQGLPLGDTLSDQRSNNPSATQIRLIFIGRIFPEKGLLVLLEALEGIDAGAYSLDIYGQVDDEEYFKRCEKIYKDKANISYHGYINSKEIVNTIGNYDVLVLPSMIAEMAPLVIREAFAANVPVIGTAIGGISEEVKDQENGLLFEMGDVKALNGILKRLINDKGLLKRLTENVEKPTSFEVIADQVEQEYQAICFSTT